MVVAAVALYLYLATRILYSDKTLLIYELNQSNVRTLASDMEANFKRLTDKLALLGTLNLEGMSPEQNRIFDALAQRDEDLVSLELLDTSGATLFSRQWPAYLELSGQSTEVLHVIRQKRPIPVEEIVAKRRFWVRNASVPATTPGSQPVFLLTAAIPVDKAGSSPRVLVANLRLDRLLSVFRKAGIAETYLIDSEGYLLAHPDLSRVTSDLKLTGDRLIASGIESKVSSEVKQFEEDGRSFLGSYAKLGTGGMVVFSRTELEQAFLAASRLMKKSALYAALVITAAFLVALFFSHSLTEPIRVLVEATRRVAGGDFENLVNIRSRDELATLASSFNSMTNNLKTSRKQIEEYSQGLERKVAERTAKLEEQNIAIKNAQEALVRTTRLASVGEIAGRAAHEVLNPLTGMMARLEKMQRQGLIDDEADLKLMLEIVNAWKKDLAGEKGAQGLYQALMNPGAPDEKGKPRTLLQEDLDNLTAVADDLERRLLDKKTDVEFLAREAERISKIVNGMRGLTRVSGNKKQIDVHAFLDECIKTMADVLSKDNIKTDKRYCVAKPLILADKDELLQVMTNLMRNSMQAIRQARKEAPHKVGDPAKIWFSTEVVTTGDTKQVFIRVSDNGPGISDDHAPMIFEPSFTTKPPEDGTGLGLSISRRFVRAYDGELTLEKSTPAVETTFLIEMPDSTNAPAQQSEATS